MAARRTSAILSFEVWQEQFGGDAGIVGRAVDLNNARFIIVGVMPAGFTFPIQPQPTEVWITTARPRAAGGPGRDHGGARLSRLARDRAAEAGRDGRTGAVGGRRDRRRPRERAPEANKDMTIGVRPLLDNVVGNLRPTLPLLLAPLRSCC